MGLMECAALCKRQSLCQSINWNNDDCELNSSREGIFISDQMYIFADVQSFPANIAKGCQYVTCPSNTLCVAKETGENCEVIGCTGIPNVENINADAFNQHILWEFNEIVNYPCAPLYRPNANVTCNIDGNWPEFECVPISSCDEVAYCDRTAVSNEYWVYVIPLDQTMKVFCEIELRMDTVSYITLINNNTATTPIYTRGYGCEKVDTGSYYSTVGTSSISKVELRTNTMTVALVSGYIQSSLSSQLFGHAADCYASIPPDACGVIGKFEIDFRGTGFKVRNDTTWEAKSSGFVHNITRSFNDSVVVGYCGGETNRVCGGCKPKNNKLYIDYNHWDNIPVSAAKKPVCQYA
ncbi:hypothetical protein LOTGIDRAFT_160628 [Lottia gigantea]|uniref:GON domain-containing protein n=1 Tax=Lottia gigantea TaxID=225164 RepID=V4AL50_LOTGI|nr:hypothetical protein LOTGIDRAFT_160628 [Lottia gigantea]ESO95475.1 hypothetical protein LOTGIDRAFT_160628 [Lottia gigantea]